MYNNDLIAHIKDDGTVQTLEDHSAGVAKLAKSFADKAGIGLTAYAAGYLHDFGKATPEFQQRIKGADIRADHAAYGMQAANELFSSKSLVSYLIGNPIAGHHRGLYDGNPADVKTIVRILPGGIKLPELQIDEALLTNEITTLVTRPEYWSHLERFVYSCIVDADSLDTERFYDADKAAMRNNCASLWELYGRMEMYLHQFKTNTVDATLINKVRTALQNQARETARRDKGIYDMTIPCGGSKTIASALWGLVHALTHGMDRIVIAIPRTSIVSQTADTLRRIFGDENVLEHHSAMDVDKVDEYSASGVRTRMLTENWDSPIVVTTDVQLYESMHSSKRSKCRKLHNLANSVIILDEVQLMPVEYTSPIVTALRAYNEMFGASVLLCTATLPNMEGQVKNFRNDILFDGFPCIKHAVENTVQIDGETVNVEDVFTRCRVVDMTKSKYKTYADLAKTCTGHEQILYIVNTKDAAKALYDELSVYGNAIHLSKRMCQAHLDDAIAKIKEDLMRGVATRVVSTTLIDTGVDVDFQTVFRQNCGCESLAQAQGRCNREGRRPVGECETVLFSVDGEQLYVGDLLSRICAREKIKAGSLTKASAVREYNNQLYGCMTGKKDGKYCDAADTKHIISESIWMSEDKVIYPNFEAINCDFKMIDDEGQASIVIPFYSRYIVNSLLDDVRNGAASRRTYKRLSKYIVNVRENELVELLAAGVVEQLPVDGMYVLTDPMFYSMDYGLSTENPYENEIISV